MDRLRVQGETMNPLDPVFILLVALVAGLYSSVGHGGASGYLALIAFTAVATKDAAILALVMNVFVATISFVAFHRAKHFSWSLTWPFLAGSIPFAFLGGLLKLPERVYAVVLALALTLAAIRLVWQPKAAKEEELKPPPVGGGVAVGTGVGLLSGMVGVGGGIFLSPVMILAKWADAKQTSATAAIFIVCNSVAGLLARPINSVLHTFTLWPVIVAGIGGAVGGSLVGANWVPKPWLRRTLSVVLIIAVVKLASKF